MGDRPMEELALMFFDKCIEEGKTLYCIESNENGKRPQNIGERSPEQWMNHWFVKAKRSEAPKVLRAPFKKILKYCFGIEVEKVSRKIQSETSSLVGTGMSESLVDISLGDMDGHAKICSLTPEGVPCQTSGDEATQVSSESN